MADRLVFPGEPLPIGLPGYSDISVTNGNLPGYSGVKYAIPFGPVYEVSVNPNYGNTVNPSDPNSPGTSTNPIPPPNNSGGIDLPSPTPPKGNDPNDPPDGPADAGPTPGGGGGGIGDGGGGGAGDGDGGGGGGGGGGGEASCCPLCVDSASQEDVDFPILFGAQQQVLCKDAGGRQGVATQYLPFPTKIQFTGTGFEYSDENGDFWRLTEAGVSGVSAEGTLDWGITNEGVTLEPQRGEEKLYEPLEVTICVNGQARQYKVLAAENN